MITLYKQFSVPQILEIIARDFPTHDIVRIDDTVSDDSYVTHALQSDNLFGNERVVFISFLPRDFWDQTITAIAQTEPGTHIIWLEDLFPVSFLKKMPHHTIIEQAEKKLAAKSNPFGIANALATGDGVMVWKQYQELLHQGFAPEELFGILWWKLKDLAKKKSGITPEFKKTLHRFMETYGSARESGGDLGTGLEKLLLGITKSDIV
jgi:hypothetical protein